MVFTQHLRVLDCAVLRHTMLMCFTIGRQPHRIVFSTEPAWELFRINFRKIAWRAPLYTCTRGRCACQTVISSRSSVVAYRGARWRLREPCGMVDPARSALSCGVWCVWVAYSQCRSGYATRF